MTEKTDKILSGRGLFEGKIVPRISGIERPPLPTKPIVLRDTSDKSEK